MWGMKEDVGNGGRDAEWGRRWRMGGRCEVEGRNGDGGEVGWSGSTFVDDKGALDFSAIW